MSHRNGSSATNRRRPRSRRPHDLDERLSKVEQHLVQLENTLQGVVRETSDVTIGGPCKCGESLVIVRQRTVYCPQCQYRRGI